jgi:hypothetical protein
MDFGVKRKTFKRIVKKSLKIKEGATHQQILQSRPNNNLLDPEDVEVCVDIWTREDKVGFTKTKTHTQTHTYLDVGINVKKYTVEG